VKKPLVRLSNFAITPTRLGKDVAFRLDLGPDDTIMLTQADMLQLRQLIEQQLPRLHNHKECDPEGHVVFSSVCCSAQLYRCPITIEGLPSKPIVSAGESSCSQCGVPLTQEGQDS